MPRPPDLVAQLDAFDADPTRRQGPTPGQAESISRSIDEALPLNWDQGVVDHPQMKRWCDELRFRVWKHKSLLLRIGTVGPDWDVLPDEIVAFVYVNEGMARKRRGSNDKPN